MAQRTTHSVLKGAAAMGLLALASHALAAPEVVWVDNESFGFSSCSTDDALPGSADPQALMRALRERGIADASQALRLRGLVPASVTLTPVAGSWRCEGSSSSMVFRLSAVDRAGQAWTSNLVSRMPASVNLSAASSR